MKKLLLICFCLIYVGGFAQSPKVVEADLLRRFKKIEPNSPDIDKANNDFVKMLKHYTEHNVTSISWPFESLKKERLDISTSTDNKLRIYSWDTWSGGTMHFFESLFQYQTGGKIKTVTERSRAEVDTPPNYYKLYTFNSAGKTYYLAVWRGIGSTKDASSGITCFAVENDVLKRVKIIKTSSGLHDELSYWYNFMSVVDIAFDKRPSIRFDSTSKTIYLPLVDSKGTVTNKFISYTFNDKYFEKVKPLQ